MNKKQTAVEWLISQLHKTRDYQRVINEANQSGSLVRDVIKEAKEMEKEQIINAINTVSENNVKYANMIVSSWSKIEGELFMHNTKLAEQYYQETYGGNK
jgi:predicted transcriptional regulator